MLYNFGTSLDKYFLKKDLASFSKIKKGIKDTLSSVRFIYNPHFIVVVIYIAKLLEHCRQIRKQQCPLIKLNSKYVPLFPLFKKYNIFTPYKTENTKRCFSFGF